jgi:hypothetical protein
VEDIVATDIYVKVQQLLNWLKRESRSWILSNVSDQQPYAESKCLRRWASKNLNELIRNTCRTETTSSRRSMSWILTVVDLSFALVIRNLLIPIHSLKTLKPYVLLNPLRVALRFRSSEKKMRIAPASCKLDEAKSKTLSRNFGRSLFQSGTAVAGLDKWGIGKSSGMSRIMRSTPKPMLSSAEKVRGRSSLCCVATQDRVFPHYVPNSPTKHSKSDSKDRSQEILWSVKQV